MPRCQTAQSTTSHRDCCRAAEATLVVRAPGDWARRKSIARGDETCEIEMKNVWPAARERPDENTREPRVYRHMGSYPDDGGG